MSARTVKINSNLSTALSIVSTVLNATTQPNRRVVTVHVPQPRIRVTPVFVTPSISVVDPTAEQFQEFLKFATRWTGRTNLAIRESLREQGVYFLSTRFAARVVVNTMPYFLILSSTSPNNTTPYGWALTGIPAMPHESVDALWDKNHELLWTAQGRMPYVENDAADAAFYDYAQKLSKMIGQSVEITDITKI